MSLFKKMLLTNYSFTHIKKDLALNDLQGLIGPKT